MGSGADDPPGVEDDDPVGREDGADALGDDDDRSVARFGFQR
jgi:hypothetical protein